MRYEILDEQGNVINTIIADESFMAAHYEHYRKAQEPVVVPEQSWLIEVPAYLRRFDWCCDTPKQAALACDPNPICQGMMNLALSRVREGIDLKSTSLPALLGQLVLAGKLTQVEANKIRTTPPKAEELYRG